MDRFIFKFILFFILSTAFCVGVGALFSVFNIPDSTQRPSENVEASVKTYKTVIIDAGHGGEDGGTSSASGLVEKDLNLEISQMLCDMLRSNGINVIMTREDDRLLYDRNVDFHGRKKVLDLAARLHIAESTPDAVFISIHMNAFSDPRYSGLQVWFSPNDESSYTLANTIQTNTQKLLQPYNNRKVKQATSGIFLLDKATCPAVLVECGFLSNSEEALNLGEREYRQKLAFILFTSISQFLEQ